MKTPRMVDHTPMYCRATNWTDDGCGSYDGEEWSALIDGATSRTRQRQDKTAVRRTLHRYGGLYV